MPLVTDPLQHGASITKQESIEGLKDKSKSMPQALDNAPISHTSDTTPARHSTQLERTHDKRRRSTKEHRPSRDFDVRRDGPYGRPSLSMSRRRSSGTNVALSPASRPSVSGAMAINPPGAEPSEQAIVDGEQPPPVDLETLQTSDPAFEPEPPPLNYTLRTRKLSIFIFWSLIVIDSTAMPIGLYWGLWYGTDLTPNIVFSIVTAALGGVSIIEYVLRFWRLWKKGSTCRVIGARRAYLDWFHWNFSFAWIIIIIELIMYVPSSFTERENPRN